MFILDVDGNTQLKLVRTMDFELMGIENSLQKRLTNQLLVLVTYLPFGQLLKEFCRRNTPTLKQY